MEKLTTTEAPRNTSFTELQCGRTCGRGGEGRREHMKSPTAALEGALRRTENGAAMPPSLAAGRSEA